MNNKSFTFIFLSLFLFISACGVGKNEIKAKDTTSYINTPEANIPETTTPETTTPETTKSEPNKPEITIPEPNKSEASLDKKITLKFNLSDAKALITKEEIIQNLAAKKTTPSLKGIASTSSTDMTATATNFTYKIAGTSSLITETGSHENGASNLLAIDKDGTANLAIETNGQIKILYTVASPDGETIYIALDNGWYEGDKSSEQFIAQRNCALYEVKKIDNSYRCVANGLYVQNIDDRYRQKISGDQKPIQFDNENNMYFAATDFNVHIDNSPCTNFETNETTGEQKCLSESVSKTNDLQVDRSDWSPKIYKQDAVSKEVKALTHDHQTAEFFVALGTGEVVIQSYDMVNGKSNLNLIQGNQVIDLTNNDWGVDFFTVDSGNTVIFGHYENDHNGQNGIRFARPRAEGGTDLASLDISLFSSTSSDSKNNPKPCRIMLGDNGRIYAAFEADRKRYDDKGKERRQSTLTVFQILPHNAVPKLEIDLPQEKKCWDFMEQTPFQISKGFLYYKESVSVEGFGTADVIKVHNLETRETKKIFGTSKYSRYKIYNWKLSESNLYFSALDKANNTVVTGEIDTSKITDGDNAETITINAPLSPIGTASAVRDIEIVPSKLVETDTGKSPEISEIHQNTENPYSMSIDFSEPIDHKSIDSGLILKSSKNEGFNNDGLITMLKVWVNKTLHLIPDLNGLGNRDTLPMNPDSTYTLSFAKDSSKDKFAKSLDDEGHSIQMHPKDGFYMSPAEKNNKKTPDAITSGRVLKYSGNDQNKWQTFDLAKITQNVRFEFSARNSHWDPIKILYFDKVDTLNDIAPKSLVKIELGALIHIEYLSTSGLSDWRSSYCPEIFNGKWSRYRLDFYENTIKISYSNDGKNFTEIDKKLSVSNLAPRTKEKYFLYLQVKELISFDNIQIIELDNQGQIKYNFYNILYETFDSDPFKKYKHDITEEKAVN